MMNRLPLDVLHAIGLQSGQFRVRKEKVVLCAPRTNQRVEGAVLANSSVVVDLQTGIIKWELRLPWPGKAELLVKKFTPQTNSALMSISLLKLGRNSVREMGRAEEVGNSWYMEAHSQNNQSRWQVHYHPVFNPVPVKSSP